MYKIAWRFTESSGTGIRFPVHARDAQYLVRADNKQLILRLSRLFLRRMELPLITGFVWSVVAGRRATEVTTCDRLSTTERPTLQRRQLLEGEMTDQ